MSRWRDGSENCVPASEQSQGMKFENSMQWQMETIRRKCGELVCPASWINKSIGIYRGKGDGMRVVTDPQMTDGNTKTK